SRWVWGLVAVLVLLAAVWYAISRRSGKSPLPPMKVAQFNNSPGKKSQPVFSPDGEQIAFSWGGAKGDNADIYVQLIGEGTPHRLTTNSADDFSPAWSPDGHYIAFMRYSGNEAGIFMVPALGGTERKIYSSNWLGGGLAWSPDGKSLAFNDRNSPQEPFSLF